MKDGMCMSCKMFGRGPGIKRKERIWKRVDGIALYFNPIHFRNFLSSVGSIWKDNRQTKRMSAFPGFDFTYKQTHLHTLHNEPGWKYIYTQQCIEEHIYILMSLSKFSSSWYYLMQSSALFCFDNLSTV